MEKVTPLVISMEVLSSHVPVGVAVMSVSATPEEGVTVYSKPYGR